MGLQARHDALRKRDNELGAQWRDAVRVGNDVQCKRAIRSSARLGKKRDAVIDKARLRGEEIESS